MITLDDIRNLPTIGASQLAEVLGVDDVDTVTAAIRRGELPGIKIGNRWHVPVPRLLAILEPAERPNDNQHEPTNGTPSLRPLADLLMRCAEALLAVESAEPQASTEPSPDH